MHIFFFLIFECVLHLFTYKKKNKKRKKTVVLRGDGVLVCTCTSLSCLSQRPLLSVLYRKVGDLYVNTLRLLGKHNHVPTPQAITPTVDFAVRITNNKHCL